jgi:hypothetical protein
VVDPQDVGAVYVDDVTPSGYTMDRAITRQKNTGRSRAPFAISAMEVDDAIEIAEKIDI